MVNVFPKSKAVVLFACVVAALLACMCLTFANPQNAYATTLKSGDIKVTSERNCILGLDGTFSSAGKDAVLKRINEIRLEACREGVPNPDEPSQPLTEADYVPMKWSSSLEKIAQIRAAEGSVCQSHTRPNGSSCFTVPGDGYVDSYGENLAWNYAGMLHGIEQWYGEKGDWVKRSAGAVTGHYASLISPDVTYVGLGTFAPAKGGWACTAGEFCPAAYAGVQVDEAEVGVQGDCRQAIEVSPENIVGVSISGPSKIAGSAQKVYSAQVTTRFANAFGGTSDTVMVPMGTVPWSSSNPSVVSIDESGKATPKACGAAMLTAAYLGKTASLQVAVSPEGIPLKKLVAKKKKTVKVTWAKKAAFAKGYQIRYSLKKSMKSSKIMKVKGATKKAATIKKLKSKKRYYVQIRSFAKAGGKMYYSAWSAKKSVKVK